LYKEHAQWSISDVEFEQNINHCQSLSHQRQKQTYFDVELNIICYESIVRRRNERLFTCWDIYEVSIIHHTK